MDQLLEREKLSISLSSICSLRQQYPFPAINKTIQFLWPRQILVQQKAWNLRIKTSSISDADGTVNTQQNARKRNSSCPIHLSEKLSHAMVNAAYHREWRGWHSSDGRYSWISGKCCGRRNINAYNNISPTIQSTNKSKRRSLRAAGNSGMTGSQIIKWLVITTLGVRQLCGKQRKLKALKRRRSFTKLPRFVERKQIFISTFFRIGGIMRTHAKRMKRRSTNLQFMQT